VAAVVGVGQAAAVATAVSTACACAGQEGGAGPEQEQWERGSEREREHEQCEHAKLAAEQAEQPDPPRALELLHPGCRALELDGVLHGALRHCATQAVALAPAAAPAPYYAPASASSAPGADSAFVPLQPHLCQLSWCECEGVLRAALALEAWHSRCRRAALRHWRGVVVAAA
jgi:hypothetical protein